MAAPSGHNWTRAQTEDEDGEEEDPVEKMIQKTGCLPLHHKVQDCMAEHRDWRKCQEVVIQFRKCMTESRKKVKEGTDKT